MLGKHHLPRPFVIVPDCCQCFGQTVDVLDCCHFAGPFVIVLGQLSLCWPAIVVSGQLSCLAGRRCVELAVIIDCCRCVGL